MKITRRQFWLLLGVETLFFVLLALWVLSRLERLFEPSAIAIAIVILVVGDVVSALLMQRYARPRITLAPGETPGQTARVISGFGDARSGRVSVRGETWRAEVGPSARLAIGDAVRVVSRDGLTLWVKPVD